MSRFKNKIVLITGAGSGIGRSTALRLDKEGATSIVVDMNAEQLKKTHLMLANPESSSRVLDISSLNDAKKCFEEINDKYGQLDALINVAGILRFDNSHEVEISNWNKILEVSPAQPQMSDASF